MTRRKLTRHVLARLAPNGSDILRDRTTARWGVVSWPIGNRVIMGPINTGSALHVPSTRLWPVSAMLVVLEPYRLRRPAFLERR